MRKKQTRGKTIGKARMMMKKGWDHKKQLGQGGSIAHKLVATGLLLPFLVSLAACSMLVVIL
jgi:hypothetical protein